MERITVTDLDDCIFFEADGNVLDPAVTPYVLMPDPKVRQTDNPCQLRIVTKDDASYLPSEVEMGSFDEAERPCGAANARMGWPLEEADGIILAPMGGGTAQHRPNSTNPTAMRSRRCETHLHPS